MEPHLGSFIRSRVTSVVRSNLNLTNFTNLSFSRLWPCSRKISQNGQRSTRRTCPCPKHHRDQHSFAKLWMGRGWSFIICFNTDFRSVHKMAYSLGGKPPKPTVFAIELPLPTTPQKIIEIFRNHVKFLPKIKGKKRLLFSTPSSPIQAYSCLGKS